MNLVERLKLENVSIEVLYNVGKDLRKQWEERFACNLSNNQKSKIFLNQYLWHLFSYEQVEHLSGQEAMVAFNIIKKSECFAFYQNKDKVIKLINSKDCKCQHQNVEIFRNKNV